MARRRDSSDDEAWELLRALDDPVHVERPADFDERATADRFATLVRALNDVFDCESAIDAGFPGVQDATHYGTATVPARVTASGADIVVRVSNFGPIAVYALGLLLAYNDDEETVLFEPVDRDRVDRAVAAAGYTVIPQRLLERTYDGVNDFWKRNFPSERTPTWWIRFFDWV